MDKNEEVLYVMVWIVGLRTIDVRNFPTRYD